MWIKTGTGEELKKIGLNLNIVRCSSLSVQEFIENSLSLSNESEINKSKAVFLKDVEKTKRNKLELFWVSGLSRFIFTGVGGWINIQTDNELKHTGSSIGRWSIDFHLNILDKESLSSSIEDHLTHSRGIYSTI